MSDHDKDPRCAEEAPAKIATEDGVLQAPKMPTRRNPVSEAVLALKNVEGRQGLSIRLSAHCENIETELTRAQKAWADEQQARQKIESAAKHGAERFEAFADAVAVALNLEPATDCDAILRALHDATGAENVRPVTPAQHTVLEICKLLREAGIHLNGHDAGANEHNVIDFVSFITRKMNRYSGMLEEMRPVLEGNTGMSLADHSLLEMLNKLAESVKPVKPSRLGPGELAAKDNALFEIATVLKAPDHVKELADVADLNAIVRLVYDLKEHADKHENAHKQVCSMLGEDSEKLRRLVSEYGGGWSDEPIIALEDLLVNLRANQMPEGFQEHAQVLVKSNARYEATLSMIQQCLTLAKPE